MWFLSSMNSVTARLELTHMKSTCHIYHNYMVSLSMNSPDELQGFLVILRPCHIHHILCILSALHITFISFLSSINFQMNFKAWNFTKAFATYITFYGFSPVWNLQWITEFCSLIESLAPHHIHMVSLSMNFYSWLKVYSLNRKSCHIVHLCGFFPVWSLPDGTAWLAFLTKEPFQKHHIM